MNKRCFRVIFNRARGLLMVVAEKVSARLSGGSRAATSSAPVPVTALTVRSMVFGLWLAFGAIMPVAAQTQVVADPSAPGNRQPVIGAAGNGVPVVNIQTPSAAGVSRNAYGQFDVDQHGLVLNNARVDVQTQQAGWVAANPMLVAGTARVILNEVNSSNPSLLRGYVEVGGDRAQVVIANPSGIQCNGCGFLNANRATLTTGMAMLDAGGNLTGYQVRGGTITVGADGLEAGTTDYTDLLARAVQVQGSIKGTTLHVVAGANDISADLSSLSRVAPGAGTAPAYGIDVAALGGMYAGKITLTANELGVGVRNAGAIGATAGDAVVTTSGQLTNSGQIQAKAGNLTLGADQGVSNSGTLKASAALSATSAQAVNNQVGATLSGQTVSVTASDLSNQGTMVAQGNQQLTLSGTLSNASGASMSAGSQTITAASATNQGTISATGTLQLTLSGALTNASGGVLSAATQTVDAASMSNQGKVSTTGSSQLTLDGALTNGSGGVLSAGNQTVYAASVTNLGAISATTNLQLTAAGLLDNQGGASLVATNTQLTSGSLINRGMIDGAITRIQTGNFDLLGTGLVMGDHLSIGASTFTIGKENSTAAVAAARNRLDLGVQNLNMSEHALLHSEGDMAIGGQLDANGQATGKATSLALSSARIEAMGSLTANTAKLSLTNAYFASALQSDPRYPQNLTEYQGSGSATRYTPGTPGVYVYNDESDHLQTPEGSFESWLSYDYTRTVQTEVVTQTDPATISVGNNFTLNADSVHNDKSTVTVGGQLAGTIGSLTNTSGQGQQIIHDAGSVTSFWREHNKGRDSTGSSTSGYNPADQVLSITLQPAEWKQNTQHAAQYHAASLTLAAPPSATTPPTLPVDSSLFKPVVDPQSHYHVETDPRFASYKTWLSTDYMLQQLSSLPVVQKRLGDGYYEQRMVREQVAQLTGRRFLQGYANDEAQLQALMNNGVTAAQTLNLRPGVALTDAQVAQLTSNIVWLVSQQATLPDGTVVQALVPKVYAKPDSITVNGAGTLIAASDLKLDVAQQLTNGGTLAGWQTVAADAQNLTLNGGQVYGGQVALLAQNDLNVQGGSIVGHSGVNLQAGHDLTLQSTTASTQSVQGKQTNIASVASVSVDGAGAALSLAAGNDLNANAAQIRNSGDKGNTQLVAGRDINLGAVTSNSSQSVQWDGDNKRHDERSQDVGSTIQSSGGVTLAGGRDVSLTAASLASDQGALNVAAGQNINIASGRSSTVVDEAHKHTGTSGMLSRSTITTRDSLYQETSQQSTLSGDQVNLIASKDISVKGSTVAATHDAKLMAGGNVSISATTDNFNQTHYRDEKTSGFMSSGGIGFTVGSKDQTDQYGVDGSRQSQSRSVVGSTAGNLTIRAGKDANVSGSEVVAKQDIQLTGKTVTFDPGVDQSTSTEKHEFKQSGLTVTLTSSALDAAQSVFNHAKQMSNGKNDSRVKALNAMVVFGQGSELAQDAQAVGAAAAAGDAKAAAGAAGIKLSLSIGSSSSKSESVTKAAANTGSTASAGGNLAINATEGDITLKGAQLSGKDVALNAAQKLTMLAATDTTSNNSTNSNHSASVGISFSAGSGGFGLSLDVAASRGKGMANGDTATQQNTVVTARNNLALTSGGDTTLKGANASGKSITANVGGNLNLASQQDTETYKAKKESSGFAVSIPITGGSFSASVSSSNSKTDVNYASVNRQTGLQAGSDGFAINVKGNTDLKGAVIASDASADKNRLTTGTLTMSDIENSMSASSSTEGFSAGTSMLSGNYGLIKGLAGNLLDNGHANANDHSTTRSAMAAGALTVTDDAGQRRLNGQNADQAVASANRDVSNTSRALAHADITGLQDEAQQQRSNNMLALEAVTSFTDGSYKVMFQMGSKMYRIPQGCSSATCAVEVSPEEMSALKKSQDGQIHVANNGIFNSLNNAIDLSESNSGIRDGKTGVVDFSQKPDNLYLVYAPQASNFISEMMVAGYQKFLSPTMGLTNYERLNADLIAKYGSNALDLDGHSRGSLTVDNAMRIALANNGVGSAAGLNVNFYGAAANAEQADQRLKQLQNRPAGDVAETLKSTVHEQDLVGTKVGGNSNSAGSLNDNRNFFANIINIMFGKYTPHNCYGTGDPHCGNYWSNLPVDFLKNSAPPSAAGPALPPVRVIDDGKDDLNKLREKNMESSRLGPKHM